MRVRVVVLAFAVVSVLVCDEFCDALDAAADKLTSCKPNACGSE